MFFTMKKTCPISSLALSVSWLLWLCSLSVAFSQVKLILPQVHAELGQVVEIPVLVANFSNVKGMQFTLKWDSTHLAFQSVGNFNLNSLDVNDFGLVQTDQGILTFAWIDESLSGETLPDSAAIFSVTFQVIAQQDVASEVQIVNAPTLIEVTDGNEILGVEVHNGLVLIGNVVNTNEPFFQLKSDIWPNPFSDFCLMQFSFPTAQLVSWEIRDNRGKLCYQAPQQRVEGEWQINISSAYLSTAGTYYLYLHIGKESTMIRKLIYVP